MDVSPGHPQLAMLAMYKDVSNTPNLVTSMIGHPAEAAIKFPIFRALAAQFSWWVMPCMLSRVLSFMKQGCLCCVIWETAWSSRMNAGLMTLAYMCYPSYSIALLVSSRTWPVY